MRVGILACRFYLKIVLFIFQSSKIWAFHQQKKTFRAYNSVIISPQCLIMVRAVFSFFFNSWQEDGLPTDLAVLLLAESASEETL